MLVAAADGSGPASGTPVAVHPAGTTDPDAPHPPGRPNLAGAVTYLGSAARFPHVAGAFARPRREVLVSAVLLLGGVVALTQHVRIGEGLSLPPFLEGKRQQIEAGLKPLA